MSIRRATPADARQILDINIQARKDGYQGLIDQAYLDSREITLEKTQNVADNISNDTRFFLVYENGQYELQGFINGGLPRDEGINYAYEIYSFYVHPNHQRKGIGSLLWSAFQEKIWDKSSYLWTLPKSKGEQFYRKYGGKTFWTKEAEIWEKRYTEIWYAFVK